jgi:MFS transporter, ACS family, D-galactonate transporter
MKPMGRSHDTPALKAILALLVLSVGLNYMARSAFGIAGPVMTKELNLRPDQLGLLLSAFFWLYSTSQLLSGWLVDRYDVSRVLGLGSVFWTLTTGLTGMVSGFTALLMSRLTLGVGESVAYPAYGKIIATHFPEDRRGTCNALIEVGNQVGPAVATLMGGLMMVQFGWRAFFFAIAIVSALWLPAWVRWAPRKASGPASGAAGGPGFLDILRQRSFWGTFLGLFSINYGWVFLVTWLPSYLVDERHFSMTEMALIGSLPLWMLAATSLTSGLLSDLWIRRGGSPTKVRKTFTAAGLVLCTLFLPAVLVQDSRLAMVLLTIATMSLGMPSSNVFAMTQTIAGSGAAGRWTGMQNGLSNLSGIVAPWLTGIIVAKTGSFYLAFVVVCVVAAAGAVSFLFIVGPVKPLDWATIKESKSYVAS